MSLRKAEAPKDETKDGAKEAPKAGIFLNLAKEPKAEDIGSGEEAPAEQPKRTPIFQINKPKSAAE